MFPDEHKEFPEGFPCARQHFHPGFQPTPTFCFGYLRWGQTPQVRECIQFVAILDETGVTRAHSGTGTPVSSSAKVGSREFGEVYILVRIYYQ